MKILSFFTNNGTPQTGLTPTLTIRNADDTSLVGNFSMTEVGDGWYRYIFTETVGINYIFVADGGISLTTAERYTFGGIGEYNAATLTEDLATKPTLTDIEASTILAKEATLITKSSQSSVDAIKSDTESIIATLSTLVSDIWSYSTRILTSFGTLVSDTSISVWTYITRTLTAGTRDAEIDAIKLNTDTIPTLFTNIDYLKKLQGNNWEIKHNKMYIYDNDGITPLLTFKLYDEVGDPSMTKVAKRVKI